MRRSDWRRPAAVAAAVACAACEAVPVLGPEDFVQASRVTEEIVVPDPAALPASAELLAEDDPELAEALREFQQTGQARIVRKPGFVRFPYGERQPILYCKPLRVCDIQLQAGESVLHVALGDSERWIASKMESGPRDGRAPHVVVKPTEFDISTNLVITTDRRVYHLGLISSQEEKGGYFRSVRFYYPQETVQRWADAAASAREAVRSERERDVARLPRVDPEASTSPTGSPATACPGGPSRPSTTGGASSSRCPGPCAPRRRPRSSSAPPARTRCSSTTACAGGTSWWTSSSPRPCWCWAPADTRSAWW